MNDQDFVTRDRRGIHRAGQGKWVWIGLLLLGIGLGKLRAQPGGADPTFVPAGNTTAFALQSDGDILVAGEFFSGGKFHPVARLNVNGTIDSAFNGPPCDGSIRWLVPRPGGRVLVGGDFGQIGGQSRIRLASLAPDGSVEADWSAGNALERSTIGALSVEPDDAVLVGIDSTGGVSGATPGLIRLLPDGSRDTNYVTRSAVNDSVLAIQPRANGDVYIGGRFTQVGGMDRPHFARLHANGSVDATFEFMALDGLVTAIAVQPDDKILIAGDFVSVNGLYRPGLARLHPDGRIDEDFDAGETGGVRGMVVQADGRIVIGGFFYYVQGERRGGMARLMPDGTIDRDFVTGEGYFRQVALQTDGRILAGGGSSPGLFRFLSEPGDFSGRFELQPTVVTVTEGTGPVQLTVSRWGGTKGTATVAFGASLFSQTVASGTLTFTNGQREQLISIPVTDDNLVRVGLSISVLLWSPSPGAQIDYYHTAEIRVLENDTGFSIDSGVAAYEDAGVIAVTIHREGADTGPLQVDFATVDGTARAGRDYLPAFGTLHFGAGETARTIAVALLDDPAIRGFRNFTVVLRNPSSGAILINGGRADLGIMDVVSQLAFSGDGDYATNEAAGLALIPVRRAGRTNNAVSVRFQTADGTARAGVDYESASGTLEFAPGETLKNFGVTLRDNAEPQANRNLQVTLSAPTGGAELDLSPSAWSRSLVILDDDRDSSLDFGFAPFLSFGSIVNRIATTPAGDLLISGYPGGGRDSLIRLNRDGREDSDFHALLETVPTSLAVANNGGCWVGAPTWPLRLLGENGELIVTAPWSSGVGALALQPDQKVVVANGGIPWGVGVTRYLPGGEMDQAFHDQGATGLIVGAIALQPDGGLLCGGAVPDQVNPQVLVRLNPDGTRDEAFAANVVRFETTSVLARPMVAALVVQPDGRILVGGNFDRAGGVPVPRLVRLNADGTLDPEWKATADSSLFVSQLAVQGDGRILGLADINQGGATLRGLPFRREVDGSPDASFAPEVQEVYTFALRGDGRLVLGGGFYRVNGQARYGLAQLRGDPASAAGEVSFLSVPASVLETAGTVTLQVQRTGGSRGRIVVPYALSGGDVVTGTDVTPASGVVEFADGDSAPKAIVLSVKADGQPVGDRTVTMSLGVPWGGAARGQPCNATWTLLDADSVIEWKTAESMVMEGEGVVVLTAVRRGSRRDAAAVGYTTRAGSAVPGENYQFAGGVLHFDPGQAEAVVNVSLLNDAWGQPDTEFWVDLDTASPGVRVGDVRSVRVMIADDDLAGNVRTVFAANLPAWIPAPGFDTDRMVEVHDLALDGAGNVLALYRGVTDPLGEQRPGPSSVVRFSSSGSFDSNFWPGIDLTTPTLPNDNAQVLASRPDGTVLVGTASRLARLGSGGAAAPGPFGGVAGSIEALAVRPDNSFYVGGSLRFDRSEPWCHLVRQLADGTEDPAFRPVVASLRGSVPGAVVVALAVDGQGRVLMGGAFDAVQGQSSGALARLSAEGEVDPGFVVQLWGPTPGGGIGRAGVRRVVVQPDGRILVVGNFNRVEGAPRPGLARLHPDGRVDLSFDPPASLGVSEVTPTVAITDVAIEANGKVVIAALRQGDGDPFERPEFEGYLVRLNPDGSLDTTFNANGAKATLIAQYRLATVNRVLVDGGGGLLIGGRFNRLNGRPSSGLARINGGAALSLARISRPTADRLVITTETPLAATIELQASADMRVWHTIATRAVRVGTQEWEVPLPAAAGPGFFRLRVVP